MKKILLFFCFIGFSSLAQSQNYDLIVNNKGDSIACRIDSITDSHIYFQMKVLSRWISTHLTTNDIISYSKNSIDKKKVKFKSGSTVIENSSKPNNYDLAIDQAIDHTIHGDIGTLAFWGFLAMNYEQTIRQKPGKSILRFRTGFLYRFDDHFWGIPLGLTSLYGKKNKYFEFTFGIVPTIDEEWRETTSTYYTRASVYPLLDIGYRHEPGKEKFFYRFKIGSTGLGIGAGYAF